MLTVVSVIGLNRMRQRIQLPERDEYIRVVARVPADLEHACRRLADGEGWALGDLCRSLIVLGACGSYLTLRSCEPRQTMSDGRFSRVVKEYLGARAYAPRTGRRSKLITFRLPTGVTRSLVLYARLVSRLRSYVYARFLQAGLLMYLTSKQRLVEGLKVGDREACVDANHCRR